MNTIKDKIKVLHIVHWPKSGIVSLLRNYFRNKKDNKFEYHLLFFVNDPEVVSEFQNICASVRSLNYEKRKLMALWSYFRIIRNISPHIIHTHSFQPGIWGRLLSFFHKGAKLISTVHSPYPYLEGIDWRGYFKKCMEVSTINAFNARVVCVSDAVKRHLLAHTRIDKEIMIVIRNGIHIDKTPVHAETLENFRNKLSPEKDCKIIISTGRLSEEKGFDVLLKAFSLVKKHVRAVLLILGDGPLGDSLNDLAKKLKINDTVRFLGYKKDVRPYLSVSDLYVCSSRFEGFGMSIIEALNVGLPVIATKTGGIAEIIKHGENGILTEPDNPQVVADAIAGFFSDGSKAESFRKNGFSFLAQFDIEQTVKRYEELYNQCCMIRTHFL